MPLTNRFWEAPQQRNDQNPDSDSIEDVADENGGNNEDFNIFMMNEGSDNANVNDTASDEAMPQDESSSEENNNPVAPPDDGAGANGRPPGQQHPRRSPIIRYSASNISNATPRLSRHPIAVYGNIGVMLTNIGDVSKFGLGEGATRCYSEAMWYFRECIRLIAQSVRSDVMQGDEFGEGARLNHEATERAAYLDDLMAIYELQEMEHRVRSGASIIVGPLSRGGGWGGSSNGSGSSGVSSSGSDNDSDGNTTPTSAVEVEEIAMSSMHREVETITDTPVRHRLRWQRKGGALRFAGMYPPNPSPSCPSRIDPGLPYSTPIPITDDNSLDEEPNMANGESGESQGVSGTRSTNGPGGPPRQQPPHSIPTIMLRDEQLSSVALYNIALVHHRMGNRETSLAVFRMAHSVIAQSLPGRNAEGAIADPNDVDGIKMTLHSARIMNNMGQIHAQLGNMDEAANRFDVALEDAMAVLRTLDRGRARGRTENYDSNSGGVSHGGVRSNSTLSGSSSDSDGGSPAESFLHHHPRDATQRPSEGTQRPRVGRGVGGPDGTDSDPGSNPASVSELDSSSGNDSSDREIDVTPNHLTYQPLHISTRRARGCVTMSLNNLGLQDYISGNFEEALNRCRDAIEILKPSLVASLRSPHDLHRHRRRLKDRELSEIDVNLILYNVSVIHKAKSREPTDPPPPESSYLAREAELMGLSPSCTACAYHNVGEMLHRERGDASAAIRHLCEALRLRRSHGIIRSASDTSEDPGNDSGDSASGSNGGSGSILTLAGRHLDSVSSLSDSLSSDDTSSNSSSSSGDSLPIWYGGHLLDMSDTLCLLGHALLDADELDGAMSAYRRSATTRASVASNIPSAYTALEASSALLYIGQLHGLLGQYAEAIAVQSEALALAMAATNGTENTFAAGVLNVMGNLLLEMGDTGAAIKSFSEAARVYKSLGLRYHALVKVSDEVLIGLHHGWCASGA